MFIQTEQTPNPATIKFLPGQPVLDGGTLDIASSDDAAKSPLAERLFAVDGVTGVFLGGDFVSITKHDDSDWQALKPLVLGALMDHLVAELPIVTDVSDPTSGGTDTSENEDDDEIVIQIKELLDTKVRPAVAQDGGDIVFKSFEEGVVYLHLQGSCAGCPSSTATLKMGVENLLRHYVPEVSRVEAIN